MVGADEGLGMRMNGLVTNANFSAKKLMLTLFINKRLVECQPIRRAIEEVYAGYLPKGGHPFAYISVRVPPAALDVNVHPTKREVRFLDQDQVRGGLSTTKKCIAS